MLLGIHSKKYEEFLFWTYKHTFSASLDDIFPLNIAEPVMNLPWVGSASVIKEFLSYSYVIISAALNFRSLFAMGTRGLRESIKKCSLGKGIKLVACFLNVGLI